ncbi:MAG: DUF2007 domain-containing protein [Deltaproteobacteria bacterium]|nr:DUF2007 domain-containing protein [Deltaproteobacteria bacterium]
MEDEQWKIVHVAAGMIEANIVAGRLETEGIPVRFRYEAVGVIYGLTLDGLGKVEVLVPAEHVAEALEALADRYDEDDMADR